MKLPFFSNNSKSSDTYFGLFLKEEEGVALLLTIDQGKVVIKNKERFSYTNGWENIIEDVDEVLYKLEKNKSGQISKTIFFIYSHFIDDQTKDIKKPYLTKIKEMVKNLELEAMGYIECFEAVTYYLEKKEEAPLTGVLLELDKKQLSIFVYKGGKLTYKKSLARTDNILDDFNASIGEIKGKAMLPSKIILYDSDNIDETAAKIVGHRWSEDHFVQIPKIEILKDDEVIQGLVGVFSGQVKGKETNIIEQKTMSEDSFGFVVGQDVSQTKEVVKDEKALNDNKGLKILPTLPKFPKVSFPKIPKINFGFLKGRTAIVLGLIIIILALFLNEYFFHKAKLTIFLPYQPINKSIQEEVVYSTSSSSAVFSDSIATTGKKDIGDKAKGSVNVHNFDDKEKIFSKGTVLQVSNLKFILDGDVKVASSSLAADGSAKLPGKTGGTITAVDIGPESNLSKGQRFSIDDLSTSEYFAINDSALTGGSRKVIRTVSKADQDKLEQKVLNKAKKQEDNPKFSKNETVISDLSLTEITKSDYSKEVGEEADKVTLTATTETTFFAYNKDNLIKKILDDLNNDVKQGFSLNKENLNYKLVKVEKKEENILMKIEIKSKAVRKFDTNTAFNKIIGKNKNDMEKTLRSEFSIQGYDLVNNEPIFLLKNILPFFKKNIELKISSL